MELATVPHLQYPGIPELGQLKFWTHDELIRGLCSVPVFRRGLVFTHVKLQMEEGCSGSDTHTHRGTNLSVHKHTWTVCVSFTHTHSVAQTSVRMHTLTRHWNTTHTHRPSLTPHWLFVWSFISDKPRPGESQTGSWGSWRGEQRPTTYSQQPNWPWKNVRFENKKLEWFVV